MHSGQLRDRRGRSRDVVDSGTHPTSKHVQTLEIGRDRCECVRTSGCLRELVRQRRRAAVPLDERPQRLQRHCIATGALPRLGGEEPLQDVDRVVLVGHVEDLVAHRKHTAGDLQGERRLAEPLRSTEQGELAGSKSSGQEAVERVEARRPRLQQRRLSAPQP